MFYRNQIKIEKEYIPYEKTVIVNRAPTDESIKLLNEMQEKTIENMLSREIFNNKIIKGQVVLMKDANFSNYIVISFWINNNHIVERYSVEDTYNLTKEGAFKELVKCLSENITLKILTSYGGAILKNLNHGG